MARLRRGRPLDRAAAVPWPTLPRSADPSLRRRVTRSGQILVMFAMSTGLLFGILAVVVDVGNLWNASLHVQHAAEAAALAGVPYMPGDFPTASSKAQAEAAKNGYSTTRPARRSPPRSTSSRTAAST